MLSGYCCTCICTERSHMSIVHVLCCDICCLCLQTGVPVLSPYTGVIVELLVEDGATVKAHQPLMKIDVSGTCTECS